MHRPLRRLLILSTIFGATLSAQEIWGAWLGNVAPRNMSCDLRVVMKIPNGGLKLTATKAPVDASVIDRARKLSEN